VSFSSTYNISINVLDTHSIRLQSYNLCQSQLCNVALASLENKDRLSKLAKVTWLHFDIDCTVVTSCYVATVLRTRKIAKMLLLRNSAFLFNLSHDGLVKCFIWLGFRTKGARKLMVNLSTGTELHLFRELCHVRACKPHIMTFKFFIVCDVQRAFTFYFLSLV